MDLQGLCACEIGNCNISAKTHAKIRRKGSKNESEKQSGVGHIANIGIQARVQVQHIEGCIPQKPQKSTNKLLNEV